MLLEERAIPSQWAQHPAVHTIAEMRALGLKHAEMVAKNLFLRDDKKRNYYLVSVHQDRLVDLKSLRLQLGSRPLSFASPQDLQRLLKLEPGSVTPFRVLHDHQHQVTVVMDTAFRSMRTIGIHPNDNTQTVWLSVSDLETVIRTFGNQFLWVDLDR